MSATSLTLRLISLFVLCTLFLSAALPSFAESDAAPEGTTPDGVTPAPSGTPGVEPTSEPVPLGSTPEGQSPAGLTPSEWQSIQAQIRAAGGSPAARGGPTAPDSDSLDAHLPGYQVAPLTRVIAGDGATGDGFGFTVDLDGEQMIVGSALADISGKTDQGAAYLFQRNRNNPDQWGQTVKIVAPDGLAGDYFGRAVAISGDIVVVGAPFANLAGGAEGAVYVFYRNQGGLNAWGFVRKQIGGGASSGGFGFAVDLADDKLVVGDPFYRLSSNTIGQAFIFYRNQGGADNWGQVQWLGNANPADDDWFGAAVTIDGDLSAVGSPQRDEAGAFDGGAVYIYSRHEGGAEAWGQIDELSAREHSYVYGGDEFGTSVSLDHQALVVGAPFKDVAGSTNPGAAFVFAPSSAINQWDMQAMLVPPAGSDAAKFGVSVDKDGQFIVIGAKFWPDGAAEKVGAAFVYQQNRGSAGAWGLLQSVTAVNGAPGDGFGQSVAISNDRIAIGAQNDGIGGTSDQGSVNVFAIQAQDWYLQAGLPPFSSNVQSVATYGEWLAVGLPLQTVGANTQQGSVYLYRRDQGGADQWQLFKQITKTNGAASDWFGFSVALYGDLLAVGAPLDDEGAANQGIVLIYKRDQGGLDNWGEWKNYGIAEDGYLFGNAVAMHDDLLAIGATGADIGGKANRGIVWLCYIVASGCSWKTASPTDGAADDGYGYPLSLDNDILAVGSYSTAGHSVYLHYRNRGGADTWGQVKKLAGSQSGESFGDSLSLSGELLAVGSPDYDNGSNPDQGRVKIYSKNTGGADLWGELVTILDAAGNDNHQFGSSVALYYDRLLAGAPGCVIDGFGCVSSFRRNHGGLNAWGRFERLQGPDSDSSIGSALAIDGETAAISGGVRSYVSYFQANYWTLGQTSPPLESSESGGLGYSLALSGDLLVTGAPDESLAAGAAYIFQRDYRAPGSWSLLHRFLPSDFAALNRFGAAVAVSGDWIAVGAVKDPVTNAGVVYLFERNTGGADKWGQVKKIVCPDAGACGFGFSLALSGSTLAVGSPYTQRAYLFYRDQGGANNWGQVKRLDSADWLFGQDVALDGDMLAVGAPEADITGNDNQGAAYVFYRDQGGAHNWGQVQKLAAVDGANCAASCNFGWSVALNRGVALVGAIGAYASKGGAAYVFYRNLGGADAWGKQDTLTASDGASGDWFGNDVAVYGDHILVGAR